MPLASIAFDFDPIVRLGDSGVRLETLGYTGAVLVALLIAAAICGRTPPDAPHTPAWLRREDLHLRRDDLLFIVLGVVPGAVVGGRIGYVLLHPKFYMANQGAILDPGQGSLELGLAVVVGTVTGAYVARLLDAPVGRWLHVAALPLLVVLGLGKLAMTLGGSGQGAPSDVAWATSYLGAGPWGSLAPEVPSVPAQLYEAGATGIALLIVVLLFVVSAFRARDGSAFFVALFLWSIGRVLVTFTWRDDPIVASVRSGALLGVVVAGCSLVGLVLVRWAARRARNQAHSVADIVSGPEWPDPEARPPF